MARAKKNSEYGPGEATKVIHKIYKELGHDTAFMNWISVFTAPLFIQIMRGINELGQALLAPGSAISLENIFLDPHYPTVVNMVADMVIWCNNHTVSPYREAFSLPKVCVVEFWYPHLSPECNEILDRAQNHLLALGQEVGEWLQQLDKVPFWTAILTNFVEIAIINANTEYVEKKFFFQRAGRPNPDQTRYFIGAQLVAFERIRDLMHTNWPQNLNDVVLILNTVIQRKY